MLYHEKTAPGTPWALTYQEGKNTITHLASDVEFNCRAWTENYPKSQERQKYFVVAEGWIRWEGKKAIIESMFRTKKENTK